jgi:magnesium-protoporphyrin IX monomethyl ester (oxidative) cyclase
MNVALVNAPSVDRPIFPPLGIMYIASYVRAKLPDINFSLIDGENRAPKTLIDNIKHLKPDVVGLSLTTMSAQSGYRIVNQIKDAMEVPIVVGGPHPTVLPKEAFEKSEADLVVLGEGEQTMLELLGVFQKIGSFPKEDLRRIDGVAFKLNKDVVFTGVRSPIRNVDEVPFPARDLINILNYPGYYLAQKKPQTQIMFSRGCPYRCTFCANPVWKLAKPWVRLRYPDSIANEFEHVVEKYGVKEVFDYSDELNPNLEWPLKVCEELIRRKNDTPWITHVRADKVNEELAKALSKARCWLVTMGVESGSEETLKGIRKNITIEHVIKALEIFRKYEIKVLGFFMIFNVWEENGKLKFEDVNASKRTFAFAKRLINRRLLNYLTWAITTPYPGSHLYNIAEKYDLIVDDNYDAWTTHDVVLKLPGVSGRDIKKLKAEGTNLQALCILRNGGINLSLLNYYAKRMLQAIKWKYFS